jgi:hypothetical protein
MPAVSDPQTVDTINVTNLKTVGESFAFALAQISQNNMTHLKSLDMIREGYLGTALERFATTDPKEAVGINSMIKQQGDSGIASLLAQLVAGQVGSKIGQSTAGDPAVEVAKMSGILASIQQNNALVLQAIQALSAKS